MNDLSCPKCRSSLYSQTSYGFVCSACGYKERVSRWAYRPSDLDALPHVPTHQDYSRERRETYDWKQTKRVWKHVRPVPHKSENLQPHDFEGRRELNQAYIRVREHLDAYRRTGCKDDLTAARRFMNLCLRNAHLARNSELIEELRREINVEAQQTSTPRTGKQVL